MLRSASSNTVMRVGGLEPETKPKCKPCDREKDHGLPNSASPRLRREGR